MGTGRRFLMVLPAVGALLLLSIFAVRWGIADSLARAATRDINSWAATRTSPGLDAWLAVRADLERAQGLSPSNPQPPELLGVMHLRRAGRAEYAEQALEHFGRSLALRPSSPFAWANVAEARYQLGMTAAPFERILVQSWRMGPSEPETQRLLADLGLAMWDEVGRDTQSAISAAIAAAMRRNPLDTLQISERRGRLALACSHVPGDKRLRETKWIAVCGG